MASSKNRQPFPTLALALLAFTLSAGARTPVAFSGVEASYHAGETEGLNLTIDGWNASSSGWSVRGKFESPQAVVFTTAEPIHADLLELSLCFLSGRPHATFADFGLSFTTDAKPSLDGNWEPLPILNFSATSCELSRGPENRLLAAETLPVVTGMIPDDIYRVSTRLPGKSITGFRIEVHPVLRSQSSAASPVMAWAASGDFVLTEFRVEVLSSSTNVALGAPVTATHPLFQTSSEIYETTPLRYRQMTPGAITDGWPSTLAHPGEDIAGKDFHFEIDLGQQRIIDHLGLRQRGDRHNPERFGKMRIKLYDQDPKAGAAPIWEVLNRPDGSFPEQGEVDILYASDGQGTFQGRYIRISTENPEPLSPMLAEIEVYETRTPQLVALMADEWVLPEGVPPRIPPGTQRLGFRFNIPQTGQPDGRLYRWKVSGDDKGWQTSASLLLEIPCPPAGEVQLEIQAAHSDGTWDASVLKVPFVVKAKFTETAAFLWLIGCGTLFAGVLASRFLERRKIRRLEAQSLLAAERSRIAANMHDDVGARIAQLAVLQDVFALEHTLPPAAKTDLATLTAGTRETMVALDEAVWTVNPRNDKLAALAAFLMQHADSYLLPLGIACRIDSANEWPDTHLPVGTRHEVALAFKEALQNIVKHADASEVKITLRHEARRFIIRVSDNGCGLPEEVAGPGHDGLINMRQRLTSIRGTCKWLPREKGGTIVEMTFPTS